MNHNPSRNKITEFKSFVKNLTQPNFYNSNNLITLEDKPKVTIKDFKKQDQDRHLILPIRRPDTNSVFSYGLKFAINQEKNISKSINNNEYFNLNLKMIKNKIAEDPNFRDKIVQRILINKNIQQKIAVIEKPFPLLKKTSNCRAISKTENFLMCLLLNHKYEIDEELFNELINYRKNICLDENQNSEKLGKSEKSKNNC